MTSRYTAWTALREVSLWVSAIPVLFPIYLLVSLSLKTPDDAAAASRVGIPTSPTVSNYSSAWSEAGTGSVSFAQAAFNSCLITIIVVLLVVAVGAPAGYVLARRMSRLARWMFAVFTVGLVLPVQLGLIPLFAFMVRLDLAGTLLGIVLVYGGLFAPFAVFLYANFFRSLGQEYEEAAQVDGATPVRAFVEVVLPLVRPVTGTVAVLVGILVWKDFLHPLVFLGGSDNVTLPVAIHSFVGEHVTQWNLIFASIVIALAPILAVYGLMQRYVVRGFTSTVRG